MRLVTVAHGTRHATGNDVARALTAAAGERLGMTAVTSYVELSEPLFADVMSGLTEPAVVVPLLLSTGYHVTVDLPRAVRDGDQAWLHGCTPRLTRPAGGSRA